MNERFLFRGKRADGGGWITGCYACPGCHTMILTGEIVAIENELTWERYEVDPATIGQCTGLRDKNGTLIFEGDIVKTICDDEEPEIYRIAFENYSWELRSPLYDYQELRDFVNDYTRIEIIGNCWDNTELLEV